MTQRVAEFAALVDRAGAFGRDVTRNAARKGELNEEPAQPRLILRDVGIDLAVRSLEIRVADDCRAAMPGSGDVNHVEVVFLDDAIQMHVDEVLPGRRAPV